MIQRLAMVKTGIRIGDLITVDIQYTISVILDKFEFESLKNLKIFFFRYFS